MNKTPLEETSLIEYVVDAWANDFAFILYVLLRTAPYTVLGGAVWVWVML